MLIARLAPANITLGAYNLGTYALNQDFTCSGSEELCVTKNASVKAQFVALQMGINRFAKMAKFTPLVADGKLGKNTRLAARAAGQFLLALPGQDWSLTTLRVDQIQNMAWATGTAGLAADAVALATSLNALADKLDAPAPFTAPPAETPPGHTPPVYTPPVAPPVAPPEGEATEAKPSNLPYIIGGAILAVGLGAFFLFRKKESQY